MERPTSVTAIAIAFFLSAAYLFALGIARLISPENVRLSLAAPLLHGLEISGPYMLLLAGPIFCLVGYGLLRLKNLARRAAIVLAVAGVVLLIPKVSADAAELSVRLLFAGFAVMVRVVIVWYLWQSSTAEQFHKPTSP